MGVSLTKGKTLSLSKQDGSPLTRVRLGLGWDEVRQKRGFFGLGGGGDIDLDASAILYHRDGRTELVWWNHLTSNDGSVAHHGDNLTGAGDGDDEQISIDLGQVSGDVDHILLTINSYSGQTFNQVENVFARVVDTSHGESELGRYNLAESKNSTGVIIAKLSRTPSGWVFQGLDTFANGRTVESMVEPGRRTL